jgi:hypothetical protein
MRIGGGAVEGPADRTQAGQDVDHAGDCNKSKPGFKRGGGKCPWTDSIASPAARCLQRDARIG